MKRFACFALILLMFSTISIADDIDVLMLFSDGYGPNTFFCIDDLEAMGWNITTTALSEQVDHCPYYAAMPYLTVDTLFTDIEDITNFDVLYITNVSWRAPGIDPYIDIINSPAALERVQTAVDSGLIVYAACAGPRVLAAADRLNGIKVTCNAGNSNKYINECIQAGAVIQNPPSFPVVDRNIITSVRGQYYHFFNNEALISSFSDRHSDADFSTFTSSAVALDESSFPLSNSEIIFSKTYGSPLADGAAAIICDSNGDLIIAGYTFSESRGQSDILLLKTNSNGQLLWSKTYGGNGFDYGNSLIETTDGNYLLAGFTTSRKGHRKDACIIKTDRDGNEIWTRTYGGIQNEELRSVVEHENNYYFLGHTESFGNGESDIYLIKTDQNGDSLMTRTYGGSLSDMGSEIIPTSDGNLAIVGADGSSTDNQDFNIIKIDPDGNVLFDRHYGSAVDFSFDWAHSAVVTDDGGFMILGDSNIKTLLNILMIKVDADGNEEWRRDYGDNLHDHGMAMMNVNRQDYISCGNIRPNPDHISDAYIMLQDSTGSVITSHQIGGNKTDFAMDIIQSDDNNYIFAGYTKSAGAGGYDVWIVKLSSLLPRFNYSPGSGHAPLEITFSDDSRGNIIGYQWDFNNDGVSDSEVRNPQWEFQSPGNYSVALTVEDPQFQKTVVSRDTIRVFNGESALRYDGQSSHAHTSGLTSLNLAGSFTIEAWICPFNWGNTDYGRIIDKIKYAFFLVGETGEANDHSLMLQMVHNNGNASYVMSSEHAVTLNEWQHVAVSYDGLESVRMYVNGIEQNTTALISPAGPLQDNADCDFFLGNNRTLGIGYAGLIDEVRIWDHVRSPQQISRLDSVYIYEQDSSLLAYWSFNEGNGNEITDQSIYGNHLGTFGTKWYQGASLHMNDIQARASGTVPSEFSLLAPYPNPFNSSTTIRYTIPEKNNINLSIYDINGRLIDVLIDQNQEMGTYTVNWSSDDISSGIYLVGLYNGKQQLFRKLTVLK